ncbi:MAG: hypothetical protein HFI34_11290 [Lachnospiraceae bacterium]|nr:hypothetical protein [Lachnospiraceae bacterium]
MAEWWETLLTIEKILYCIAVPSTIILVLQTLVLLFGADGHEGINPSDTSGLDLDADCCGPHHGMDFSGTDIDMGGHTHGDWEDMPVLQDFDTLRLFTVQGLVGFFTTFSWASIAGISQGVAHWTAMLIGFILGVILMYAVAVIIKYSRRLAEDGTFHLKNTLGQTATVYLPIPPERQGQGKVNITVHNRFLELSAVTNEHRTIKTGESVRITDIINDSVVVEID